MGKRKPAKGEVQKTNLEGVRANSSKAYPI